MSVFAVPVNDARAVLDEEAGSFTIEVRLSNGTEVQFTSNPGPDTIAELKAAMSSQPVKPKRRRTRRKTEEA